MIPVTKPFLPPREEYDRFLDGIWDRIHLTNNGPLVRRLEEELRAHVGCDHVALLANGTLALQLAIRSLNLRGEVITTPFSYVASTSSIVWEFCTPVFVDIDENSFNIDPTRIESAITEKTVGILGVHVYGIPCDVVSIDEIARKHSLPVIYDASHAFGVSYLGKPLLSYGTISTASFHATKLFHSIEGGATITSNPDLHNAIRHLRNFGHDGPDHFVDIGINAKNSEFHAAMGLANLGYVPDIVERRRQLCGLYDNKLSNLGLRRPVLPSDTIHNYCYYPIVFETAPQLLDVMQKLADSGVMTRRYFHPSLDNLPYLSSTEKARLEVTASISERVLCLPLYHDLMEEQVISICQVICKSVSHEVFTK